MRFPKGNTPAKTPHRILKKDVKLNNLLKLNDPVVRGIVVSYQRNGFQLKRDLINQSAS